MNSLSQTINPLTNQVGFVQLRRGLNSSLNQTIDPSINQVGLVQPKGSLSSVSDQTINPLINHVGFVQQKLGLNSNEYQAVDTSKTKYEQKHKEPVSLSVINTPYGLLRELHYIASTSGQLVDKYLAGVDINKSNRLFNVPIPMATAAIS